MRTNLSDVLNALRKQDFVLPTTLLKISHHCSYLESNESQPWSQNSNEVLSLIEIYECNLLVINFAPVAHFRHGWAAHRDMSYCELASYPELSTKYDSLK